MLANNKVVRAFENPVYNDIQAFFNELEQNTVKEKKKTRESYEANIRQFFKETRGKDIEHITLEDLQFKRNDIVNYRKHIFDKFGYANGTINQKIASIKSLYVSLEMNEYDVKPSLFAKLRLKDNPKEYEVLSESDAYMFANTVWETERVKPLVKYLSIMFAIRTSFRLDEILNMKWEDFKIKDGVCEVTALGKGDKNNVTSITVNFYEQILELKEINDKDNDFVFQISTDAINDMMKRLRNHLNIDKSRRVVFHSLRKTASSWLESNGATLKEISEHLNHSNVNTTMRYLDKKKDLSNTAGVRMEEDIDMSFMEEMSIEDFKEFFKQASYKIKMDLKNFIKNKLTN